MLARLRRRNGVLLGEETLQRRTLQPTNRRATVLGSMLTIRTLLRRRGYNVDQWWDESIADMLVEVCAGITRLGLSPRHLIVAAERLSGQHTTSG